MAYNFQGGNLAIMSGSLIQEGTLEAQGISSIGNLSGSGNLRAGGTVRLDGVVDAALDVASDSFYYRDGDALMKRDTMADYATAIAGVGIGASSGVLAVDLQELSEVAIAAGDFIAFTDTNDSNKSRKETIDDVAALFAGSGMAAASAVISVANATNGGLTINANDMQVNLNDLATAAVDVAADSFAIIDAGDSNGSKKESIADLATAQAGEGILASSGVYSVDLNEITAGAIDVSADSFAFVDATDNSTKKESYVDLATAQAGVGLQAGAGALSLDLQELSEVAIAAGDFIAFTDTTDSNKSRKETIDDVATLFAGNGLSAASAVMALDLNELSAAAVDVANDSIAIVDATDSSSKKESIADLVTAMAGAGLTATNGVLSTSASGAPNPIGDAAADLLEGVNYGNATLTADRIWTAPASAGMSAGDKVVVKAPASVSTFKVEIKPKASDSQTIDGSTDSIFLESNNAAVTLIYVAANTWVAI